MESAAYRESYNRLNNEQKRAVDTIEGPVMVIAGPGTGKTQILTLRIANILLKTDVNPENILALTFTEAGARAMKERLFGYIGSRAHRVKIATFHEFCSDLIRYYPDAYDRVVGGRAATDLEKISLIESIIETGEVSSLRPHGNPSFYIKPIMSALALMKREYVTPELFLASIERDEAQLVAMPKLHEKGAHKGKIRSEYQLLEKKIAKHRELLFIYHRYHALLAQGNLYDFEDMILETVYALEHHEDMLRDLQEQYHYIHADEHQDVNGSQNRILELLTSYHEQPNLFVVGDEKQSIFRFQGASLENFLYFEDQFRGTTTIALSTNYRSVQAVLDVAHALITEAPSPAETLRVPLTAHDNRAGTIEKRIFVHEAIEDEFVVNKITTLIKEGIPPSEIALIVRSNQEVETFAHLLRKHGVAVRASAEGDILKHPITEAVRMLVTTLVEPENENALVSVLHAPYLGIPVSDLVKIFRARSGAEPLTAIIGSAETLNDLGLHDQNRILTLSRVLNDARSRISLEAPHRVLEYVLRKTGFLSYLMEQDPLEGGRVVRRLYDEIESLVKAHTITTVADMLTTLAQYITHNIALPAPYIDATADAVAVMTAHKSKGLEFTAVFIPHLVENHWGDSKKPEYFKIPVTRHLEHDAFDRLDDERKLLYVALTRAKKQLYLSLARTSGEGRVLSESPLVEDLKHELIHVVDTAEVEEQFSPMALLGEETRAIPLDASFLLHTLNERGLSATSLNNYLASPWNYFYRNVLRIPEVQPESAQFGTALHNALKKITAHHREEGEFGDVTLWKKYLEQELIRLPITVHEYTRLHERGLEALVSYLTEVKSTIPRTTREEVRFEAELETGDPKIPRVRLTGNLDRLDFDSEGRVLRVIDYKSGKPKTRGFIEGTTKDSNGDYKRQLTFYALLLSFQDDDRVHTRTGVLSFVEADEKGKIHEEAYVVTDEEIDLLRGDIIRVAKEIAHGAFLNAPCDSTTSEYCALVDSLRSHT